MKKNDIPHTYILKVIELIRDSFYGSVDVYTQGSCTKFAMILKYLFPDGDILSDHNHTIFEYDNKCYDINGFAEKTKKHKPIMDWGIIKAYEWMENKYKIKESMREIKFRGKRLHINEWVYGSLYIRPIDGVMKYYIIENDKRPWRRVDPDTISEYTGLKDKNGIEIYGNSLIKEFVDNGASTILFRVYWNDDAMQWRMMGNDGNDLLPLYELDINNAEVLW